MKFEFMLYEALVAAQVPSEKASAVVHALETDMLDNLATKADMSALKVDLAQLEQRLEQRLDLRLAQSDLRLAQLEHKLTLRLGAMLAASVGAMAALVKLA
jgi:hypothetical protein